MSKLQGISPKLPLTYSRTDGPYTLNKNLGQTIRQNMRMLLLASPGERIMFPEFGVGLHRFLFEQTNDETYSQIVQKIQEQVSLYLPAVNLKGIDFVTSDEDPVLLQNQINISIRYNILPLNVEDQIIISSTMTT